MKQIVNLYKDEEYILFLEKYCNWQYFGSLNLSFDIDFAPDYMINYLIDILEPYEHVKATFFVTHNTPVLDRIRNDSRYELAIHPFDNILSTQGKGLMDIVNNLLGIVPESIGNRFHRLEYSYNSFFVLKDKKQLYDASLLRFDLPFAVPAYHKDIDLVLIPYTFEDGTCGAMGHSMKLEDIDLYSPGIKGVSFHPLNLYLNCSNGIRRKELYAKYGNINHVAEATVNIYRNLEHSSGPIRLLKDILGLSFKGIKFIQYKELAFEFKKLIKRV